MKQILVIVFALLAFAASAAFAQENRVISLTWATQNFGDGSAKFVLLPGKTGTFEFDGLNGCGPVKSDLTWQKDADGRVTTSSSYSGCYIELVGFAVKDDGTVEGTVILHRAKKKFEIRGKIALAN